MAAARVPSRLGFVSTRGAGPVGLAEALYAGLAPDGGLFLPASAVRLGRNLGAATFQDTSAGVADALLEELRPMAGEAARAAIDFPVPLVELAPDTYVLELFHGPSCAFKDVGARFMAQLMHRVPPPGDRGGTPRRHHAGAGSAGHTVLVATSGDTGGAVASAFAGRKGCRVVALFPNKGISEGQRRQMTTLAGNVTAVAVRGTFDDCQRLAKEAFADSDLSARHRLTSANSINIGRLLPQIFYYVHASCLFERPPRFVVPSGNLGNLCAGLLALAAGAPMAGLVAACNANDAFRRYLAGEKSSKEARSRPTPSSAMDVAWPSNLERIRSMYPDLAELRRYATAVSVSDEDTIDCMARSARRGYLLDPHGAVGVRAHELTPAPEKTPTVILATAHPAKFPETVWRATGQRPLAPPSLERALAGEERWIETEAELDALASVLACGSSLRGGRWRRS